MTTSLSTVTHWYARAPLLLIGLRVRTILMVCCSIFLGRLGAAQTVDTPTILRPTSWSSDLLRDRQLSGDTTGIDAYFVRSSSLLIGTVSDSGGLSSQWHVSWLAPGLSGIINTAVPFSMNDGALWAGVGPSGGISGGFQATRGRLRVIAAPEWDLATNVYFSTNHDLYFSPAVPASRNIYSDPWYAAPYSADVPRRFGNGRLSTLDLGQSGVWYDAGPLEVGLTSESMWWGPGIQNAIVMSDNAAGIPRMEIRTPRPLRNRAGAFEWVWFTGGLSESAAFDTNSTNNTRSISAMALTWRPWFQPTLTLGATRAVYATASGWRDVPFRWFDVFANTGNPNKYPAADSSLYPGGRDQIASLFARWVFPTDGFEAYSEWARQVLPASLRDFLVSPTNSEGYTLGFQWLRPGDPNTRRLRVQAEVTDLEQSSSFLDQPVGVFYTSRRVIQGYTQDGQVIGAAIGPGASSQWLAFDRVSPTSFYGVTFNRIRWNEDVRSTYNWDPSVGYCNHDVSLLPGVRGGRTTGAGYLSGQLIVGTRLNAFFQNKSGCTSQGLAHYDVYDAQNTTLSVTFTPFRR